MPKVREHDWSEAKMNKLNVLLDQGVHRVICAQTMHCSTSTITARTKDLVTTGKRPASVKATENVWTQDMKDQLVKLIKTAPDMTRADVAKRLGVSRNSIAGQVHRLQGKGILPLSEQARQRRQETKARRTPRPRRTPVMSRLPNPSNQHTMPNLPSPPNPHNGGPDRDRVLTPIGPRLILTATEQQDRRRATASRKRNLRHSGIAEKLLQLRSNQCRYIEGDPVGGQSAFCEADRVKRYSYCQEHQDLCTVPLKPYAPKARDSAQQSLPVGAWDA